MATRYPVNCGHVPETMAPDGCEIDAYLLGVNEPVERFHGRCIAPRRVNSRNRGRTHVSTRLRAALIQKILLALTGASTHVANHKSCPV
jgi:hypothetical protein